jgi:hypothetical protein
MAQQVCMLSATAAIGSIGFYVAQVIHIRRRGIMGVVDGWKAMPSGPGPAYICCQQPSPTGVADFLSHRHQYCS